MRLRSTAILSAAAIGFCVGSAPADPGPAAGPPVTAGSLVPAPAPISARGPVLTSASGLTAETAFASFIVSAEPSVPAVLQNSRAASARPTTGMAAVLAKAYLSAAASAPDKCNLPVSLLAAIGQVESGSAGGRVIGADHRVVPSILGPVLSGGPFAAIRDTDGGRLDGDGQWDRAVGPMQFIPGTWKWSGVDGDQDGRADPQNVFDAAASAAGYLCRASRDLSRPADLRSAILAYNHSNAYLATVLSWNVYFDAHGLGEIGRISVWAGGAGGRANDLPTVPVPPPTPPAAVTAAAPAAATKAPAPGPTTTGAAPSPTATATASPTATATASPTATATASPTTTATASPTATATASPTGTASPTTSPTATATASPTTTATASPTTTATASPTTTATASPTTTATAAPVMVEPRMVVTVESLGEELTFLLGPADLADETDLEVYTKRSPLGAAVNGRYVGDTVAYEADDGSSVEVTITDAEPFEG